MVFRFCKNQNCAHSTSGVHNEAHPSPDSDRREGSLFWNIMCPSFLIIEQVSTVPYQLGKLTRLNSVSLAVAPAAAEERAAPSSWKFV